MTGTIKREDVYIQWLERKGDGRIALVRVSAKKDDNLALEFDGRDRQEWLTASGETPESVWKKLEQSGFVDDAASRRAQGEFRRIEGFGFLQKE